MGDEKDLDALFERHSQRKAAAKKAADLEDDKRRAFRKRASEVVDRVIVPALEELAEELRARGNRSAVKRCGENVVYPDVEFSFGPGGERAGVPYNPVSKLEYTSACTSDLDRPSFQSRPDILVGSSRRDDEWSTHHSPMAQTRGIDHVDAEWVRAVALAFVEEVLRRI